MDYNWFDIRKKVISACKKTFIEQGVFISDSDIEKATDLFDRIISYPIQYPAVGNLQAELQQSLQGAFVDSVGSSADLRNIQNLMDPFLKKTLVMAKVKTIADIARSQPSLKFLLQDTGASATFCGITHKIEESNIETYYKDSTGAYILCKAYLGRNTVHESREMDVEDVYRQLRFVMSTYILIMHHMSSTLISLYPKLKVDARVDLSEINETGYVYDFINYGDTSNRVRNRIVESFILHFVFTNNSSVEINTIVKEVIAFSRQSLSEGAVRSILGKLIPDKLHYENTSKKRVLLNDDEQTRIKLALNNYTLLVKRLLTEIENLLDGYGLSEKASEVYEHLKIFFEENCMSIIKIMNEDEGDDSYTRSEECIDSFKSFLKNIGCAEEQLDELFKGLLKKCALNDVLVKIALGKQFSSISNPESFVTGLKQREKKVYLDTQLLLYALCDYDSFSSYDSPYFHIVKSLIEIARQNPNIHLATISQYVNEVAYHLKRAVQLITGDDCCHEYRIKLSNNVFYSYYYYLKENELLNEGIETLSDFLYELFEVSHDDLLQGGFEARYYSYLVSILEDDYLISVEDTPYYSETEIENSETVFTTALLARNDNRSTIAVRKDAIMGLYLFSGGHDSISAPFFLSWDRTFYSYRKEYIKRYVRGNVALWHLFSPAKFLNHLNLLDMKIDADVLTEDLISIIEDDDTAANTKHVLDSIRKLFEKSNVTSRKKRRVYSEIIFTETDFPNDTVSPDDKQLKNTSDFAMVFDKVLTMMQTGEFSFSAFSAIVDDENRFKGIVSSIMKRLEKESIEQCALSTFSELKKEIMDSRSEG